MRLSEQTLKGIHLCCDACVDGVGVALKDVEGVESRCDIGTRTLTLTANNNAAAQKALDALAAAGYHGETGNKDLADQAVADGIVPTISARTVGGILDDVDLQPHRTRYWRTTRLDARFKRRAEKVLWCYANAERLARDGLWVVCADEMPNRQVLERVPIRRGIPGSIEQREFDYTRHGTVNILNFLIVQSGRMKTACLEANDADHYYVGK